MRVRKAVVACAQIPPIVEIVETKGLHSCLLTSAQNGEEAVEMSFGFIAPPTFDGERKGYVFTTRDEVVGYR